MKVTQLKIEIVVNLGNYESLRLGAEWTPETEDVNAEMQSADAQLRAAAAAVVEGRKQPTMQKETTAQNGGKELLTVNHPKLQAIVKKIENGAVDVKKVLEYYDADEQVINVLNLAEMTCQEKKKK